MNKEKKLFKKKKRHFLPLSKPFSIVNFCFRFANNVYNGQFPTLVVVLFHLVFSTFRSQEILRSVKKKRKI